MAKIFSIGRRNYRAELAQKDKLELLEEMVRFQEDRTANGGELTIDMMHKGIILFGLLEKQCETQEMFLLASYYRKHLEYELSQIS